ncbi:MAG: hypothetical protein GVY05_04295 [Bacteroidetes bacterium]|jgi:hypothetical protein|nr:hypothetical protein [Bacteroidota bacterium]
MSQDLKFNYKTKYLKSILILGIMYVILGVLSIFLIEESNFLTVLIFFGFISLIYVYLWKSRGYVFLNDKGIYINRLWSRHIAWNDFKGLRYYNHAIKLLYKNKSINIDKNFLSEKDVLILEKEMKKRLHNK